MTKARIWLILDAILILGLFVVAFISAIANQYAQAAYTMTIVLMLLILDDKYRTS